MCSLITKPCCSPPPIHPKTHLKCLSPPLHPTTPPQTCFTHSPPSLVSLGKWWMKGGRGGIKEGRERVRMTDR